MEDQGPARQPARRAREKNPWPQAAAATTPPCPPAYRDIHLEVITDTRGFTMILVVEWESNGGETAFYI